MPKIMSIGGRSYLKYIRDIVLYRNKGTRGPKIDRTLKQRYSVASFADGGV
jgi:hypothetical protein